MARVRTYRGVEDVGCLVAIVAVFGRCGSGNQPESRESRGKNKRFHVSVPSVRYG